MAEQQSPIPARSTDPAESSSWREYARKLEQEAPNRYEDAAKFLLTIISLSLSLLLAVLNRDLAGLLDLWGSAGIGCWMIAMLAAFWTFLPEKYQYSSRSVQSVKDMQRKIIRTKRTWLLVSFGLFFVGLVLLLMGWGISEVG